MATSGPDIIRRGRFWLPLIALFTGARLGEIAQLGADDVVLRGEVYVFVFRPDPDEGLRLKNESAERVVPVHHELVRCGLLTYAQEMLDRGEKRLFPDLPIGNHYRHDATSKWFARFLKSAGADRDRTSFHSFRHNFRDALGEAGVAPERIDEIMGWTGDGAMRHRYGSGLRAKTLTAEVAKVKYDIDLSRLHVMD